MFGNVPDVLPHVNTGKLVAIALSDDERIDSAADVPTFKEEGFGDFTSNSWFGLIAPAGTPEPILQKMSEEVKKALDDAEVRERLANQGFVAVGTSASEFQEYLNAEFDKAEALVKASGATAN